MNAITAPFAAGIGFVIAIILALLIYEIPYIGRVAVTARIAAQDAWQESKEKCLADIEDAAQAAKLQASQAITEFINRTEAKRLQDQRIAQINQDKLQAEIDKSEFENNQLQGYIDELENKPQPDNCRVDNDLIKRLRK